MNSQKPDNDRLAYHVGRINLSGLTMTKVILWLVALTIVSFVIGFGLLAFSGELPSSPENTASPFSQTARLTPNTTTVPHDGATSGSITIRMGAGEVTLRGNAPSTALIEATVFSKEPEWQPAILASRNGTEKIVTMTEKGHNGKEWFAVDSPNSWDVRITEIIPLNLSVEVGAGETSLELGSLNLASLAVNNGAGDTKIDLSHYRGGPLQAQINNGIGDMKIDFGDYRGGQLQAQIHNGIGDLTVRIDKTSNTRITVHGGVGDVSAEGIAKNNEIYTTAGFNPALPVSEIAISQGVGSIHLEAV
jgi:hypothetical protein